jgi:hypothetical protein
MYSERNLSFLIVGVLAVLAFVKGPEQTWLLAGVFAIFAAWSSESVIRKTVSRIKASAEKKRLINPKKKTQEQYEHDSYVPNDSDPVEAALLRHVSCRISAYLKSAYPEITWEWCSKEPEKLAVEGGTGRIRLFGIPDFNYADVILDQQARIDCEMLRIVPFAKLNGVSEPAETPKQKDDQPVDPEVWYGIQGKKILEACIADLNSHGHASLIIKENGDICVRQADKEVIRDSFKNLPGKSLWQALVKIIENQGLSASAMDDYIKVSW